MQTPNRILRNMHLENIENFSTPLRVPASPFLRTLGHGTGVSVYRLDRPPKFGEIRSPWAVKRVTERARKAKTDGVFNERILIEANILRELNHPNIVGFRGIVKSVNGVDTLALECCKTSLGTILEERHDDSLGPLPAEQCLKVICDVAKGLDYLHTVAKLLHGDLKSFNILVKGEFEICKLCDFGVSLPLDENGEVNLHKQPNLKYVGSYLWWAPEIVDELEIIDSKVDIFSLGLVIYETLALVPPHMLQFKNTNNEDSEVERSVSEVIPVVSMENPSDGQTLPCEEQTTVTGAANVCSGDGTNAENAENIAAGINADETDDDLLAQVDPAIGTRPLLPQAFQLTNDYNMIVEMFYCCTNEISEDRPTAHVIWSTIENN